MRLAWANWPGKPELAVYAEVTPRTSSVLLRSYPLSAASSMICVVSSEAIATCNCGSSAAVAASEPYPSSLTTLRCAHIAGTVAASRAVVTSQNSSAARNRTLSSYGKGTPSGVMVLVVVVELTV